MPSSTPSSSCRRHYRSRKRKAPLVTSSLTGATTLSTSRSVAPPARPRPWNTMAAPVAANAPQSRPATSRLRGSGSYRSSHMKQPTTAPRSTSAATTTVNATLSRRPRFMGPTLTEQPPPTRLAAPLRGTSAGPHGPGRRARPSGGRVSGLAGDDPHRDPVTAVGGARREPLARGHLASVRQPHEPDPRAGRPVAQLHPELPADDRTPRDPRAVDDDPTAAHVGVVLDSSSGRCETRGRPGDDDTDAPSPVHRAQPEAWSRLPRQLL